MVRVVVTYFIERPPPYVFAFVLQIPFRDEWTVTNLKDPFLRYNGEVVNVYVNGHGTLPSEAIYWIPPSNFFGNKV